MVVSGAEGSSQICYKEMIFDNYKQMCDKRKEKGLKPYSDDEYAQRILVSFSKKTPQQQQV